MNQNESIANLKAGLKQLRLELSATQIAQIETYLQLLQKWNKVYNLTAIRNPAEMLTHHVFDSLAVAEFFKPFQTILDVGTGAGLPGLMLAIVFPDQQFTLLDSNSKKTSFIKQVIRDVKLTNVSVETCRLEAYQPAALFDCVTSRAFASLSDFVNLTARLILPTGRLLALKGPRTEAEMQTLGKDRPNLTMELSAIEVPFLAEQRFVVTCGLTGLIAKDQQK